MTKTKTTAPMIRSGLFECSQLTRSPAAMTHGFFKLLDLALMENGQFSIWNIEIQVLNTRNPLQFHPDQILLGGTVHFSDFKYCFVHFCLDQLFIPGDSCFIADAGPLKLLIPM